VTKADTPHALKRETHRQLYRLFFAIWAMKAFVSFRGSQPWVHVPLGAVVGLGLGGLRRWYHEFVHIHVFVGIHETIKSNQEDLKH